MLLNAEQRSSLDAANKLPSNSSSIDWDAELSSLSSLSSSTPRPIGNDGATDRESKNKAKKEQEKIQKQLDKWKLENPDADWFPGFSAKDAVDPDEPWFTG